MSFTSDVKTELSKIEYDSYDQERAFVYGFLLFGKSFSARSVSCCSDYEAVAFSFAESIKKVFGIIPYKNRLKSGKYTMRLSSANDRKTVIEGFDHSVNDIALRINRGILEDESCYASFLRGAFMTCGSVSDPYKGYHLEFVIPHYKLSQDLLKILTELNLKAKYILRKYSHVIYLKDSESIEDLLTAMGATESSLKLMQIKINKDVRNKINRQINFEQANLSRAIDAGLEQVRAIEIIEKTCGFDALPDELKELALIRKNNPDMTLKELGQALKSPISRSGVNHRLKRIISIAEKYS